MNLGKESEMVEFKTSTGELKQAMVSVSAMLNKHGIGTIYFGVRPNGEIVGQEVSESSLRDVSRAIYESIKPEIYPKVEEAIYEGKSVIRLEVSGDRPPYSCSGRYYLRTADEDREMGPDELRSFFVHGDSSRSRWENSLSSSSMEELDVPAVKRFIEKAISCGRLPEGNYEPIEILNRFGLAREGRLTNAGEHLFGRNNPIEAKAGVFATDEKLTILDMKLFEGNIYGLLQECDLYIKKNIRWRAEIKGLERVDVPEIPEAVIREVLANAFAHAYYGGGRSIHEICVHPGFISVYSPGGYASRFDPEEYIKGIAESDIRNPSIAKMLYLSDEIEQFGSGFKRIDSLCKDAGISYSYQKRENGFKFIVYRPASEATSILSGLNPTEVSVLALLRADPSMSTEDIASRVSKTPRTVQRALISLQEKRFIKRNGKKLLGSWEVLK